MSKNQSFFFFFFLMQCVSGLQSVQQDDPCKLTTAPCLSRYHLSEACFDRETNNTIVVTNVVASETY